MKFFRSTMPAKMRLTVSLCSVLALGSSCALASKKPDHAWLTGKILDESQARNYVGTYNDSSTSTSARGSWNDSGYGGSYSGSANSSTSGMSTPVYRVYENLVVEGGDTIYITSERLRWRWSKGAHVTVNNSIEYYVEGRKLHIQDQDGKEHAIQINKAVRKEQAPVQPTLEKSPNLLSSAVNLPVSIQIDSTPAGADIDLDGAFVGSTPSAISTSSGAHELSIKKKGYSLWTRKLRAAGESVHVSAELEVETPTTAPN